jgi:hypothetical protein
MIKQIFKEIGILQIELAIIFDGTGFALFND